MQKLKFTSPENAVSVIAQWKDLIKSYKLEEHSNKVNKIGLRHIVSFQLRKTESFFSNERFQ